MIRFEEITPDDKPNYSTWVNQHPDGSLFHCLTWLDFICLEHQGQQKIMKVLDDNQLIGYWPFIIVKKGPFRLMGSPLRGWLTSDMGPLLNCKVTQEHLEALKQYCKSEKISYFECSGPAFDRSLMIDQNFSFNPTETWILDLEDNEDAQWAKLDYNCKKNLKKAFKSKLSVRQIKDEAYFEALYQMVEETYKRKKLATPFSFERLKWLNQTIGQDNKMLFIGIFDHDKLVGGHIWGYDNKTAYAFVSASDSDYFNKRVNNLMIWEGIKAFGQMGLKQYDMYGGSKKTNPGVARFKASFGSRHHISEHYRLSLSKPFGALLKIYEKPYLKFKNFVNHLK